MFGLGRRGTWCVGVGLGRGFGIAARRENRGGGSSMPSTHMRGGCVVRACAAVREWGVKDGKRAKQGEQHGSGQPMHVQAHSSREGVDPDGVRWACWRQVERQPRGRQRDRERVAIRAGSLVIAANRGSFGGEAPDLSPREALIAFLPPHAAQRCVAGRQAGKERRGHATITVSPALASGR